MDGSSRFSSPLLTIDDIKSWKAERDAARKRVEELIAQIDAFERKLSAASVFLDGEMRREIFGGDDASEAFVASPPMSVPLVEKARAAPFSRQDWLNDLLLEANRGLTHEEILEAANVTEGPAETMLTLRALTERMARRGRLRRRADYIYHPMVVHRIEKGEIEDRPGGVVATTNDIRSLIRNVLADLGPSAAKPIIAKLWTMPEALPIMQRNAQYPYAMLSRMAHLGELDKTGNVYALPHHAAGIEATSSPGANGSETTVGGEVGD